MQTILNDTMIQILQETVSICYLFSNKFIDRNENGKNHFKDNIKCQRLKMFLQP